MPKTNLEAARALTLKAESDWQTVAIGLEHGAPLDVMCFHIQQTAEKLLKALLAWRGLDYPLTHDLRDLLGRVVEHFPSLKEFRDSVPQYTTFAVVMRYDASVTVTHEETLEAYQTVGRLKSAVRDLLPPEARS